MRNGSIFSIFFSSNKFGDKNITLFSPSLLFLHLSLSSFSFSISLSLSVSLCLCLSLFLSLSLSLSFHSLSSFSIFFTPSLFICSLPLSFSLSPSLLFLHLSSPSLSSPLTLSYTLTLTSNNWWVKKFGGIFLIFFLSLFEESLDWTEPSLIYLWYRRN